MKSCKRCKKYFNTNSNDILCFECYNTPFQKWVRKLKKVLKYVRNKIN